VFPMLLDNQKDQSELCRLITDYNTHSKNRGTFDSIRARLDTAIGHAGDVANPGANYDARHNLPLQVERLKQYRDGVPPYVGLDNPRLMPELPPALKAADAANANRNVDDEAVGTLVRGMNALDTALN